MFDYCVIGGGIVGLATARALRERRPDASIVLIEKEIDLAIHQTGHNSGVIHAGIYYEPGSLKARLCREGLSATIEFCQEQDIPFEQCGKLIVATNPLEEERIAHLYERAVANGLSLQKLEQGELREREPNIVGRAALLSPLTGIVDYRAITGRLAEILRSQDVVFEMGQRIEAIQEADNKVTVSASGKSWECRQLVVCGGLQADRLARIAGMMVNFRIVPFRGEYFQLPQSRNSIVSHLIYPAPDPSLPFLGVHLTRMIDGSVTVGPNAVIGMAREGYAKFSFNMADTASYATFPGFWRLVWQNRRHAIHELKGSVFKSAYLRECQKYCPDLTLSDLLPYRDGIRAQVVLQSGVAAHDFLFLQSDRMLHVCNAPSPAATSALPIGKMIAEQLGVKAH